MRATQKILVTGAAGFIGSAIVRHLCSSNHYSIVAFARPAIQRNLHHRLRNFTVVEVAECDDRLQMVYGDLTDDINGICEGVDAVIHAAALTFVDRSILSPDPFIQSNVIGTMRLLEDARKYKVQKFLNLSCFDQMTRAYTRRGLISFQDLRVGDEVLSVHPIDRVLEWKPIQKIIIQQHVGQMVHWKSRTVDLMVTPNHRVYYVRSGKADPFTSPLLCDEAASVAGRALTILPFGRWVGVDSDTLSLPGIGEVSTIDFLYILGAFIGDGFVCRQVQTKISRKRLARDPSTGRLMSIPSEPHVTHSRSERIFLKIPVSKRCRKRVEETLTRLGVHWHAQSGESGECIFFSSKAWADLFEQCGKGAMNKTIPDFALIHSSRLLQNLFDGLMETDGSKDAPMLSTSSDSLAHKFVELCYKLGRWPAIYKQPTHPSVYQGRAITPSRDHQLTVMAGTSTLRALHGPSLVDYSGPVWCVTVPDNKNLLVERNGRFMFSGNTDEVLGPILEGAHKEDAPSNPSNPYSASKQCAESLCIAYARTYGLNTLIARMENVYGPLQHPQKAIPQFCRCLSYARPVTVYGDGLHVRQWLHIDDAVNGLMHLLDSGASPGDIYHIAGARELTNKELALRICKAWDLAEPDKWITFVDDKNIRPGHDRRYALSTGKMQATGWRATVDLDTGIPDTVRWYRKHPEWLR